MMWSSEMCLVAPRMAFDAINLKMLELEVAKEILGELFDIRTHEVDAMIEEQEHDDQHHQVAVRKCYRMAALLLWRLLRYTATAAAVSVQRGGNMRLHF